MPQLLAVWECCSTYCHQATQKWFEYFSNQKPYNVAAWSRIQRNKFLSFFSLLLLFGSNGAKFFFTAMCNKSNKNCFRFNAGKSITLYFNVFVSLLFRYIPSEIVTLGNGSIQRYMENDNKLTLLWLFVWLLQRKRK